MKVRCIKTYLTDEEKNLIGMPVSDDRDYRVTENKDYLVIEMVYLTQIPRQNGLSVSIIDDHRCFSEVPIFLFKVVDSRLPSCWQAKIGETTFSLSPKQFNDMDCFNSALYEDVPEYVEAFKKTVALLENEFAYSLPDDEHVSANRFLFEIKQIIDDVKINKWNYQRLSDVMADLIAKIKPEENTLHTRVLDAWAVIFNQSLDTPSDKLSSDHVRVVEGILTK